MNSNFRPLRQIERGLEALLKDRFDLDIPFRCLHLFDGRKQQSYRVYKVEIRKTRWKYFG